MTTLNKDECLEIWFRFNYMLRKKQSQRILLGSILSITICVALCASYYVTGALWLLVSMPIVLIGFIELLCARFFIQEGRLVAYYKRFEASLLNEDISDVKAKDAVVMREFQDNPKRFCDFYESVLEYATLPYQSEVDESVRQRKQLQGASVDVDMSPVESVELNIPAFGDVYTDTVEEALIARLNELEIKEAELEQKKADLEELQLNTRQPKRLKSIKQMKAALDDEISKEEDVRTTASEQADINLLNSNIEDELIERLNRLELKEAELEQEKSELEYLRCHSMSRGAPRIDK
jgi:hypothetical protein